MKKVLALLLILCIFLVGCEKETSTSIKAVASSGIVAYYREGDETTPGRIITLNSNHVITYGHSMYDGFSTVELSDSEYQEIVNYLLSEEFLNLESDLSDDANGVISRLTVYYDNIPPITIGGVGVTNKTYLELINMLERK